MILELLLIGGGGTFIYRDYKKGFQTSKTIIERLSGGKLRLTGLNTEDFRSMADKAVADTSKDLAKLRDSVADIEASLKMSMKQVAEQRLLAEQFGRVEEEALKRLDEETAIEAAVAKVEATRMANMFQELIDEQGEALLIIKTEHAAAEINFDQRSAEAERVRIRISIANSRRQVYELVSTINPETGLTAKGNLDRALMESEREMFKTASLLRMAQGGSRARVRAYIQSAEVSAELEATRQKIALPENSVVPALEE